MIVRYIWNFDLFDVSRWKFISEFWQRNGTISGFSDYMFFLSLLVIVIVWIRGWKKFYKIQYVKALLKPFEYFSKKQIEKYSKEDKHVVIKNLTVGEKITIDDLIAEKIKEEEKTPKTKESENLRQGILQKIIQRKGK